MTYEELRADGKGTYQLFADRVLERGSELFSSDYEQTIMLKSLQTEFDRVWCRSPEFSKGMQLVLWPPFVFIILRDGFGSTKTYLAELTALVVIVGLVRVLTACRKVEWAVFKNLTGTAVLSVARSGNQTADFDLFIQNVVQNIKLCREANEAPKPTGS